MGGTAVDMDCNHPAYIAKDGKLLCATCGKPSPKAAFDGDGNLVNLEPIINCPHCGKRLTASGKPAEEKADSAHEDKSLKAREDKRKR